jgi:hypothetical protein
MKRFLFLSAAVGMLAVAPSALAGNHSSTGTVIAFSHGGVLVANRAGAVTFFAGHARVGSRVVASGSGLRIIGLARTAHVRGIVAARRGQLLVLSAAHRLFPLRMSGRVPAAASSRKGPQPGDMITATVAINPQGSVVATSTEDDGEAVTTQVQATVTAVGANSVTLDVNGQTVVLPLPAGTTLPTTSVGTTVTLTLTFANGNATANEDDQGDDNDQGDQTSTSGGDDGDSGFAGGDGGD